jgi:NAD-dependent SIR2 family protein deacetylase
MRKEGARRAQLSEHLYRTLDETARFLNFVIGMRYDVARTTPTKFYFFIELLALRSRSFRAYTQNINGLKAWCPRLSET